MFERILVPLDGSDLAEWALEPAFQIAKAHQADVVLLRSMIPVFMTLPVVADEYEWVWPEYAREQIRAETRQYLHEIERRYAQTGLTLHSRAPEGDAASMIVDAALDESIDLIVMSTHGWSGLKRWMFGSVTERVLHRAPCPVLVTRPPEIISRVLITLDGSNLAEKVLEPALAIAASMDARVTILRINEPLSIGRRAALQDEWQRSLEGQQMRRHRRQEAESYVESVAARFAREDILLQTEVIDGPSVERIMEFADLHAVNLVAMSTHGRTGLQRWLYGSVTAKVMRSSTCSMLIVRPPISELF